MAYSFKRVWLGLASKESENESFEEQKLGVDWVGEY